MTDSLRRIVIKVGTSVLTAGTPRLSRQRMLLLAQQAAELHAAGHEVLLVSSGAVAAGRERLNFPNLPPSVPAKQMLAAIGQGVLMQRYADLFDIFGIVVAQVLLTRDDVGHRPRFLNARDTLLTLIDQRVIPIINENDTIATEEIRVGDNDNLSALVAALIEADRLIIVTDQPGLYTADPRTHADAQLIPLVERIDDAVFALAGGTSTGLGTGGMVTKLQAAQLAARGGVTTVIVPGAQPGAILSAAADGPVGTRFLPDSTHLENRKRWLLVEKVRGRLHVDAGAARKVRHGGASLLPVGVTRVDGDFIRGQTVGVIAPDGREIAHGLASYDAADAARLIGVRSAQIVDLLGYSYGDALIHRNNMIVLK